MTVPPASGPILFAYDGSDLAKLAIDEAGRLFGPAAGAALVLTIWQPFDVGFLPPSAIPIDAAQIAEVRKAAEDTAAAGASLADAAGFQAQGVALEGAPSWKAIADFADERDTRLIVLGSHGRSGLSEVLVGSVAGAVAAHSPRSVLIVHRRP